MQTQVEHIWEILTTVEDPEVPVINVCELGIIRNVEIVRETVFVTVTPTYSGCPAVEVIDLNIRVAIMEEGYSDVVIKHEINPPWSTDDITEAGRQKLLDYGIAPPNGSSAKASLLGVDKPRACPQCGSEKTELLSQFGSTACKALYRCLDCREPFDYFKCH